MGLLGSGVSLGSIMVSFGADLSPLQGGLGAAGKALSSFASSAPGLLGPVAAVLVGVGVAAIGVGAASVDAASKFETAMLSNVAHAGLAKDQVDKVSASVLQMSTDVGRVPTALAEALYPILSGFSGISDATAKTNISLLTLKDSFEAVAGTTVKGSDVANAAIGTFNALGLATNNTAKNTQNMTNLFDVMDKTVQLGNMQWGAYQGVVSKLAVSIQGTGISFNEASAALATMTNEGYSAQKAQTYLSNTFGTLAIKTDTLAKHAAKLGIEFDAAKYGPMSLADKLMYLNQITDGNKQKLLALMGNNSTALKTFNALSAGIEGYKGNLDALNKSQGALKYSFDEVSKGFAFQGERVKAAGEALMVALGTKLLPVLTQLEVAVVPIITTFTAWITSTNNVSNAFAFLRPLVVFLHPVLLMLNAVLVGQLIPSFLRIWTAIQPLLPGLGALAMIAGFVVVAALVLLARGIGIVAVVFSGFIQAASGLITFFVDLFAGKFTKLGGDLSNIFTGIKTMILGVLDGLFPGMVQAGINLVQGFINGILSMIGQVGNAASQVVQAVKNFLGFASPAKMGPGTELDKWGPNLAKGFAEGIRKGIPQVQAAVNLLVQPTSRLAYAPAGATSGSTTSSSSSQAVTIIIEMDGKEIARGSAPHIAQLIRVKTGVRR